MADWDPFAIEEANEFEQPKEPEPAAAPQGDSASGAGPVPKIARIRKADTDYILKKLMERLKEEKPWNKFNTASVDTLWHTPTCTPDDWRHIDVKFEMGEGGIAYVIFNRPNENNTLQDTLGAGINDALMALHACKDRFRMAVFTGEGKMYCAGGDPKGWQSAAAAAKGEFDFSKGDGTVGNRIALNPLSEETCKHLEALGQRALSAGAFPDGNVNIGRLQASKQWLTWAQLPQFTVCLANGSAMGGGVGCVCCCDYVISVKRAYFVLSEVKIGVIPATISPYVVAKIGTSNCKRLFSAAENLTATRAKEIGMVNEVVKDMEEGHQVIRKIAESISKAGPQAIGLAKRLAIGVAGQPISELLMFWSTQLWKQNMASDNAKDGILAEKEGKDVPWLSTPIKPLY